VKKYINFCDRQFTGASSTLDAQKAFDIANHFIIFSALVDAGIKINLFVLRIVDVTIVYL